MEVYDEIERICYKVVEIDSKNRYVSPMAPYERYNNHRDMKFSYREASVSNEIMPPYHMRTGEIVEYRINKETSSDFCDCDYDCCKGIHVFPVLHAAMDYTETNYFKKRPGKRIVILKGKAGGRLRRFMDTHKMRVERFTPICVMDSGSMCHCYEK